MDKRQAQAAKGMVWRDHLTQHATGGQSIAPFAALSRFQKRTSTHGERNCAAVRLVLPIRRQTLLYRHRRSGPTRYGSRYWAFAHASNSDHRVHTANASQFTHRVAYRSRRRPCADDHASLMFFPEGKVRVFLYGQPVCMRLSFDGLYASARHTVQLDPFPATCSTSSILAPEREIVQLRHQVEWGQRQIFG